ncbi:hypothetical protein AWB78_08392 [Caballeronia calidae]|uniref:Uncharacterized protein n=1 Tax=Caballeronia calidae TaxID=1777139 RepID=A0A158EJM1_9BURK|nr:hypothetical protein [Caballeronia calidae]SAL07055.1 hypothetical protein AWB78_08392 [Caballeronia calidae]
MKLNLYRPFDSFATSSYEKKGTVKYPLRRNLKDALPLSLPNRVNTKFSQLKSKEIQKLGLATVRKEGGRHADSISFAQVAKKANSKIDTAEQFIAALRHACALGSEGVSQMFAQLQTVDLIPSALKETGQLFAKEREQAFAESGARDRPKLDLVQGTVLVQFCKKIKHLPHDHRTKVFADVLEQIATLDPAARGMPLAALASVIWSLPSDTRAAVFDAVSKQVLALDGSAREKPLAALASVIWSLPGDRRADGFHAVLTQVLALDGSAREKPLAALASAIESLPDDRRADGFGAVLTHVVALDGSAREKPLAALASAIGSLPDDRSADAFGAALTHVVALDGRTREQPLANLSSTILYLPEGNRKSAFDAVYESILALDFAIRGQPLLYLSSVISSLPADDHEAAFYAMLKQTDTLDAKCKRELLRALVLDAHSLPYATTALNEALERVDLLGPDDRAVVLKCAGESFIKAPADQQLAMAKAVLTHIGMLDSPTRASILQVLVTYNEDMSQPADRVAALDGILEQIGALDATDQLNLLDKIDDYCLSNVGATREGGEMTAVFGGILNKVRTFDKAAQPGAWKKLLQRFKNLPGNAQMAAFDALLQQIDTLDVIVKQGALNQLQSDIIPSLPANERLDASARIQQRGFQG